MRYGDCLENKLSLSRGIYHIFVFVFQVVPYLLKFLDNLTNIYVRFNRKRLKGRTGEDDCHTALSTLYNV